MSQINDIDSSQKQYAINLILLGETEVGKSSLINRYINNTFQNNYLSTFGVNFFSKKIKIYPGTYVIIKIWDTAGQERFRSITPGYIKKAHGALIVYDISKRKTFERAELWIKHLTENSHSKEIIIVGNKTDLNKLREVDIEEGEELALKMNCLFGEVSAKNGDNVKDIFERITKKIYESHKGVFQTSSNEYDNIDDLNTCIKNGNSKKEKCCN